MEAIPIFNDIAPSFSMNISLGNRDVEITCKWNNESEAWYMDFIDSEYEIYGLKIVHNYLLLKNRKNLVPDFVGDLILLKTDDSILEDRPDFDNLGNGFDLFYVTSEEAESWEDEYGVG